MRKILLTLFILTFSLANAQIDFEKGYFISNSGTKTECYIKNLDWRNNPTTFEYKISPEDKESLKATIAAVEEFGIDNSSKFKRYKINIERSVNQMSELTVNKNPIWKEETLFLKVLIEGHATLFYYADGNVFKYFFETKSTPAEQLIRIKYINTDPENGASGGISENNQFRQQLFTALKCGAISENDFKNLNYDTTPLMKVFKKYNSCINPEATNTFEEKAKKDLFSLTFTPGINYTSLSITDPNVTNYSTSLDGKITFKIGVELEYTLPFNKNTWSVFINPAYQKYKNEKQYIATYTYGLTRDVNVVAEYSSVEIPIGIRRYFYLNQNSKIFVNGAFVLNYFGDTKMNFDNGTIILESASRHNFAFGIGYKYKDRFSAEIRTNTAAEILSDYSGWSSNYSATGIVLGYRFLKF